MRNACKPFVMFLLLAAFALAHGAEGGTWEKLGIPDPVGFLALGAIVSGFFVIASVYYRSRMGEHAKKLSFVLIAIPVVTSTLYMSAATVHLNLQSVTGGPVHWHADYEIWVCGEEHELIDPEGLANRVGTPTVHEHNDNRIHIEGVLLDLEEASLQEYFESIGGDFDGASMSIPTDEGLKGWENGDHCNGLPARWYVFVNEQLKEDGQEHVIAPYPTVPPGDMIKLVFTEKPAGNINPALFEVP